MPYADPATQKAYQRAWVARRRTLFFKDKTCGWCSSSKRLELHHVDTEQKESHSIWSWGAARREAEIAKCIVLCRDCHRRAHAEARRIEAELRNTCGTIQSYWRGCRCDACKQAGVDYRNARAA